MAVKRMPATLFSISSARGDALWSHAEDVVIMGAFGGHERGWDQVSARLDWAARGIKANGRNAQNVVTVVGDDLAWNA